MLLNTVMEQKQNKAILAGVESQNGAPDSKALSDLLCRVGRDQDRQSFITLFEHFAPRIKSFLMKGGASEAQADELAQETMLNVWDKAASFNPKQANASTWIFTIARNKRIDALRKIKRISVDFDEVSYDIENDEKSPLETLAEHEQSEALGKAIATLPEEQALLIKKSFFEDKSHAEIADETGIALGTVKSRIRLALERLRKEQEVQAL